MIIDSFLGIRNTEPIRSIPDNALSACVDCDISDSGKLSQRNGYVSSLSLSDITTGYSTQDKTGYVVDGGVLKRVDALNAYPLISSTATSFADFSKVLFTNDGYRIENDVVTNLSIPSGGMSGPTLMAGIGSWPAGRYTSVYCYRDASGLEGPCSATTSIDLIEGQSVIIAPPPVASGYTAIVYITEANGTVFFDATGALLNPVQLEADSFPLNSTVMAFYDSALYLALPQSNGTTWIAYSFPYLFHLYDFTRRYCIVPGEVRDMKGTPNGLVIATDAAIYTYSDDTLTLLANYGVPKGRSMTITPQGTVKLFSNRGVCEALPFVNLTETKALFAPGTQCSTALVDQDGIQKFITLTDGSGSAYNTHF